MNREYILKKVAEKLDSDTLAKLAAEVLTDKEIAELQRNEEPAWLVAVKQAAVANGAPDIFLKEAFGEEFAEGAKNLARAGRTAVTNVGDTAWSAVKNVMSPKQVPSADGLVTQPQGRGDALMQGAKGVGSALYDAASNMGTAAYENPGPAAAIGTAGALGTAAATYGLYRLAKKMGLVGQEESEQQPKTVMASLVPTREFEERLNKFANDREVEAALTILLKKGLL